MLFLHNSRLKKNKDEIDIDRLMLDLKYNKLKNNDRSSI